MMTEPPRVVVVAALPAAGLELLSERFTIEAAGTESRQAWLRGHAAGADAIVADPSIPFDEALLDSVGSSLKVVANFGVGHDNVDLEAARARGVRVTNTPGVLTNATAELAVALMLACGRRMAEADAMMRRGEWAQAEQELLGRELAGATVGLVGFGRIGRRVATLLRGFEVRLLVASRSGASLTARRGAARAPGPAGRVGVREPPRPSQQRHPAPDRCTRLGAYAARSDSH